jgi:hypothetical protein
LASAHADRRVSGTSTRERHLRDRSDRERVKKPRLGCPRRRSASNGWPRRRQRWNRRRPRVGDGGNADRPGNRSDRGTRGGRLRPGRGCQQHRAVQPGMPRVEWLGEPARPVLRGMLPRRQPVARVHLVAADRDPAGRPHHAGHRELPVPGAPVDPGHAHRARPAKGPTPRDATHPGQPQNMPPNSRSKDSPTIDHAGKDNDS